MDYLSKLLPIVAFAWTPALLVFGLTGLAERKQSDRKLQLPWLVLLVALVIGLLFGLSAVQILDGMSGWITYAAVAVLLATSGLVMWKIREMYKSALACAIVIGAHFSVVVWEWFEMLTDNGDITGFWLMPAIPLWLTVGFPLFLMVLVFLVVEHWRSRVRRKN